MSGWGELGGGEVASEVSESKPESTSYIEVGGCGGGERDDTAIRGVAACEEGDCGGSRVELCRTAED